MTSQEKQKVLQNFIIKETVIDWYKDATSDINFLYKILEKIYSLGFPYLISHGVVTIYKKWLEEPIAHKHNENTMFAIYEAVYEFIVWYNEQKEK